MIFVATGNATQRFRRLLEAVDKLAGDGLFAEETVIIQSGNDHNFSPKHCKRVQVFHPDEFMKMIKDATLVICHGGAGTLHHVFLAGKVPVVMPRRKQYGEHVDDNQIDLIQTLSSEGRIIPAYEPEDLIDAIVEARHRTARPIPPPPSLMLALIGEAIEELIVRR